MGEPQSTTMTFAAYLAAEQGSETKHEYLRGEVFAMMAGGTPAHAALTAAVSSALTVALHGRPCQVFSSDLRIRIEATDLTTYPDISVVCSELELSALDRNAITNPSLLVEVLSDSTEAYDRGDKFAHYRRLPSLREYLIVSQRKPWIESWRKSRRGVWKLSEAGVGEVLQLAAVEGVTLEIDALYRNPFVTAS